MKLLKNILVALTMTALLGLPIVAQAALEQPPGQIPINEPLHPIEPGVKPNYKNNIEGTNDLTPEDENTAPAGRTIKGNAEVSDEQGFNDLVETANEGKVSSRMKPLIFIIIFGLIVIGIMLFLYRKFSKKTPPGSAGTAVIAAFIIFYGFSANLALAQAAIPNSQVPNPPKGPVERTITVEGEEEVQPFTPVQSNNRALYGITAVGLLILAGGALYYFVIRPNSKSPTLPPQP